jgi:serine/threonine protein kinase
LGALIGMNHARAHDIFEEVFAHDPAERARAVRARCEGDAGLEERVMVLLAAYDRAGGFLAGNPDAPAPPAAEPPDASSRALVGVCIGPYRILELLGEGGFGSVYMAEQHTPLRRRVALKVLKPGMDSRQVVARFEAERQALALMDHPNIARVLDAGQTSPELGSRPYFVMELVRGEPITAYSDAARLSPAERVELLIPVCLAVQHAHQKGVIHRDIKPSNVLVALHDGRPCPKVIDFGIAKATAGSLTDKTLFTEFRQLVGTPAYMSPEQAGMDGLDIDARTDVYSLGVLLYELLTGSPPFDARSLLQAGVAEMQRIIRETEPPRPSTRVSASGARLQDIASRRATAPERLGRLVRGELDWIVMKSMEKERARRYEAASALADDLRRYLEGEPVSAGPPTRAYRARRFVRRHRAAVAAGAGVFTALLVGMAGTGAALFKAAHDRDSARDAALKQQAAAEDARLARDLAQTRADRAGSAAEIAQVGADFLDWGVGFGLPGFSGAGDARTMTVTQMLDICSANVESFYRGRPRLQAAAHFQLGRMYARLSRLDESARHITAAIELWDAHGQPDEPTMIAAYTHLELIGILSWSGLVEMARWRARKHQVCMAYLDREAPEFAAPLRAWGDVLNAPLKADEQEIRRLAADVLDVWRRRTPDCQSPLLTVIADAWTTPLVQRELQGRSRAAEEAALEVLNELSEHCPDVFARTFEVYLCAYGYMANVDSPDRLQAIVDLADRVVRADLAGLQPDSWMMILPRVFQGRALANMGQREAGEDMLAGAYADLARLPMDRWSLLDEAFEQARWIQASTGRTRVFSLLSPPPTLPARAQVEALLRALGTPASEAAAADLARAVRELRTTPAETTALMQIVGGPLYTVLLTMHRPYPSLLDACEALLALPADDSTTSRAALAGIEGTAAEAALWLGRPADAELHARRACAARTELNGPDHWLSVSPIATLGRAQAAQGKDAEAQANLLTAYSTTRRQIGPAIPGMFVIFNDLLKVWSRTGDTDQMESLIRAREDDLRGLGVTRPSAWALNLHAWTTSKTPALDRRCYESAERLAVRACELRRSASNVNTLGAARCRVEKWDGAIADLLESESLRAKEGLGPDPFDWLFIARARAGKGDAAGAREAWSTVRALTATYTFTPDEAWDWVRLEAEFRPIIAHAVGE